MVWQISIELTETHILVVSSFDALSGGVGWTFCTLLSAPLCLEGVLWAILTSWTLSCSELSWVTDLYKDVREKK